MSSPSRAQLVGLRGMESSDPHASLNAPAQSLQPLSRGGFLGSSALSFSLRRHALGMVAQRNRNVGMARRKTALRKSSIIGRLRPRQIALPSNWRGQYPPRRDWPPIVGNARPRRHISPTNCVVSKS